MSKIITALFGLSVLGGAAVAGEPAPNFKADQAAAFLRGQATPTPTQTPTPPAQAEPESAPATDAPVATQTASQSRPTVNCDANGDCVQEIDPSRGFQLGRRAAGAAAPAVRQAPATRAVTRAATTVAQTVAAPTRSRPAVQGPAAGRPTMATRAVTAVSSATRPRSTAPLVPARRAQVATAASALTDGNLMINFPTGSATLPPQARANAREFAIALSMADLRNVRIAIEGHTDGVGDASANKALSERRAAAVRTYLIQQGVEGSRLVAIGYGEERFANPSDPTASVNRRVLARKMN
jgi:OmpA-OmpF porin, OOP family